MDLALFHQAQAGVAPQRVPVHCEEDPEGPAGVQDVLADGRQTVVMQLEKEEALQIRKRARRH